MPNSPPIPLPSEKGGGARGGGLMKVVLWVFGSGTGGKGNI